MLGDKLKELRISMGKSQQEVAKKLNISFQNLSNWERNISSPKISELPKIADCFGVSVDYLVGFGENEKNNVELFKQVLKETGLMKGKNLTEEEMISLMEQVKTLVALKQEGKL